jgi:hypothetical protein
MEIFGGGNMVATGREFLDGDFRGKREAGLDRERRRGSMVVVCGG